MMIVAKSVVSARLIFFLLPLICCAENAFADTKTDTVTDYVYRPIGDSEIILAKAFIDSLPKLYPIDESYFDSGFSAFKIELLNAISIKDTSFIYQMLDDRIHFSYGLEVGIESFKNYWGLDTAGSDFWETFRSAFELGGTSRRILLYTLSHI